MATKAAGGGFVMAFTTLLKFALYALGLSAFWGGLAAGINYSISFVLIQLLHFTVATKQPAMTAPAMAAKLKDLRASEADRKSTRLNSSHQIISYAVFCLKKKTHKKLYGIVIT